MDVAFGGDDGRGVPVGLFVFEGALERAGTVAVMPACVNHSDLTAQGKCFKCGLPFCDGCLAFSVNGASWCAPCGHALADDVKPRWALGGLVLGAGFGLTTLVWIARIVFAGGYPIPYFIYAVMLGYAGSLYAGWSVLASTTGDAPEIERRPTDGTR